MTASLTITPTFTSAWNSGAPTGATACAQQVCTDIGALLFPLNGTGFTQNVQFDWQSISGAANSTWDVWSGETYTSIRNKYLALTGLNSLQTAAYISSNIPATTFFPGTPALKMTTAIAYSLGIISFTSSLTTVCTLNSGSSWDTDLNGTSCNGAKISMYSIIWHEISEMLGRECWGGTNSIYYLGDWWTFGPGFPTSSHDVTGTDFRYLSHDSGTTLIAVMSSNGSGDFGDTADSQLYKTGFDAFAGNNAGAITPYRTVPVPAGTNTGASITIAQGVALSLKYMTLLGWGLTPDGQANAGLSGNPPISNSSIKTFRGFPHKGI